MIILSQAIYNRTKMHTLKQDYKVYITQDWNAFIGTQARWQGIYTYFLWACDSENIFQQFCKQFKIINIWYMNQSIGNNSVKTDYMKFIAELSRLEIWQIVSYIFLYKKFSLYLIESSCCQQRPNYKWCLESCKVSYIGVWFLRKILIWPHNKFKFTWLNLV